MKNINIKRVKKGFTLAELLLSISIFSILSTFVILQITDSTDVAKTTAIKAELKSICSLQKTFFKKNLEVSKTLEEVLFKSNFEEDVSYEYFPSFRCRNSFDSFKVEATINFSNTKLSLDGCNCIITNGVIEEYAVIEAPVETEPVIEAPVETEPIVETPVETEPVVETPVETEPVVETPVESEPIVETPVESEPVVETPVESEPVIIEDYIAGNYNSNSKFDFLYCPSENYVNFQGLKYCFKNYVTKATTGGNLIAMVYQDVNISIPLEVANEIIKLNSIKFLINTDSNSLSALTSLKEIKSIINVDINSSAARSVLNNLTYIEEIFLTNVPFTYNWRDTVPKPTIRLDKNSYICLNFSKLKVKVRTTPTSSRTVSYTEICEN